MRVLYLVSPQRDMLAFLTYIGLCEALGQENVDVQPHEAAVAFGPEAPDGQTYPWMRSAIASLGSRSASIYSIGEYDLVVLSKVDEDGIGALARLVEAVGRSALRKLAVLDGEDYTATRWDLIERFWPDAYCKTSMVPAPFEVWRTEQGRVQASGRNVRIVPFPLAAPMQMLAPSTKKDVGVVFLGGNNWRPAQLRREGVENTDRTDYRTRLDAALRAEFGSLYFSDTHLPYYPYMHMLGKARVAISVGGHGIEPLRTYEILSSGALLMRERIDHITPWPLQEGVHCRMFDVQNIPEMITQIRRALDADVERATIASAGNLLCLSRYTPVARAKQLLSDVGAS